MHRRLERWPFHAVRGVVTALAASVAAWSAQSDTTVPAPTTTFQATSGMAHTVSAQTIGAGRLTFSLLGTWYQQERAFPGAPPAESHILTGLAGFSFGVNSAIDLFAMLPAYWLLRPSPQDNGFGAGSFSSGVQGSLPLPRTSPLHLGAQLSIIAGTGSDQINRNREDGYNYFETRTGFDFTGKIMESLVFGTETGGVKLHLNQGAVTSLESEHDNLLLIGGGMQGIVHAMVVLGIEANLRTNLTNIRVRTDPFCLTPSIMLRTPYYFNAVLGSDISLAGERVTDAQRALEPFRIFGGFVFSFDALEGRRRAAAQREQHQAQEKDEAVKQASEAQARADSLAKKAREDSLAMAADKEAERQRADALARKSYEDSVALADTKRQLDEEVSKRSDAEKQLLSTGLLLLDAVYFETGKAEISINSRPYLNIIGKMLTKYPKLQIEVSGHTDNTGGYQTNLNLSQSRADAVRMYLIQVTPELSSRITAHGYGPTQPKAENNTADGRKVNRRVELQVLNKEALREYNR